MPEIKDSFLVSRNEKKRVSLFLTNQTIASIDELSKMMDVSKSRIVEKSVDVYTDAVIKEMKEKRKLEHGTS
mgnify:CR=1 FL=1|jgi:hypothetical protein|tara:strand:- start:309 stop:524 length:216 start_codon:yes stop_codon:yes gene_type:complete